ncbi:centriolar and ciliogenesis-associated protein HYLS1 isoform X1 [Anoplopoma fimbria]|uniref:centriolar and ciliogenesis-associated protein HYLS1 isoform X1 n=1 Tax=Anoplopoma fimbria TaxID=229290 RepID=UPI0023EB1334|nr:centriolar and ciliogenesis-associated protein HYLS1 isoform X1 [Anoplopoma fimbria]
MDNLDFTEEEIQEQLAALGYKNIPKHRLCEFKQDLDDLVRLGEWKSVASSTQINTAKSQIDTSQQGPPAFIKEKVGHGCGEGFFLHARKVEHDRQVLTTRQNRDSYAQHSVALNLRLPPGAPSRLQVEEEPDLDETLHPPLTDSYTSTPDSHRGRFIKRKVLRKHKGQSLVCDESIYSEEDAASCLEERLADLHLSSSAQRDFETENEDVTSQSETQSSETDGVSFSAFESYIRGMTRTQSDGDLRPKPKSFIRPAMSQQTIKKTDPVAKYFQYKQLWEMFKLPGEKDRRSLRWEIKERLAYRPPPPKPRRVFVPNTYIVPTEKKRSALRWEIRNDLANGLLPHKFGYEY